ncbi:1-acyl-sn-glycerol-3-phosphate acyltransferase [Oceanobacillus piezotolerans]|uniref:1-acyl-sn-glycerol-3-phosphate acyltransferase n=1 Tax=Oceanobacillus piezotolerans TaxID=2448030 RepID=A0A498D656_9BACI|nr:lysophospholipid acyltransferase family protein [Oceanobacillus piezotolerans]RLL40369.1 1-acyl-sn-glycerol-3-phosphate acyltransferase [Oceanobacillus piezotolerans]
MIRTIGIYIYSGILILSTIFKLQKTKNQLKRNPEKVSDEEIFTIPNTIPKKVIKATGSTISVKGREKLPDEAVLFVANHQGLFDILAMLGYLGKPVGFIAKEEIKKLPIVSDWMELIHCVFIDRGDRRQSMQAIGQGINHLKAGHSMVIFPEGTRGHGRELNEFKPGSFRLGTKANVPIVPVTIDGTYPILEGSNGRIKGSDISLEIHDPIYPETYQKWKSAELAKNVQGIIGESLETIQVEEKSYGNVREKRMNEEAN